MGNHRRSDAVDASKGGSLLSRMTKDGQPLAAAPKRSLADRITRDDDNNSYDNDRSYGRLKGDERDPFVTDFSEKRNSSRGLADRITRDDGMNIRGRAAEGIKIRGKANGS